MPYQPRIKQQTADEKISQQLIGSPRPKPNISSMVKTRVHLCRGVVTPTPAKVLSEKTGAPQNPPRPPAKQAQPLGLACSSHTFGQVLTHRRPDFNSRASQVRCGFNPSEQNPTEPGFHISRVPVFGPATFSSS